MNKAIASKRLDLLQWLATIKRIKWTVKLANKVVENRDVEMLAWMVLRKGCPIDATTYRTAKRVKITVLGPTEELSIKVYFPVCLSIIFYFLENDVDMLVAEKKGNHVGQVEEDQERS